MNIKLVFVSRDDVFLMKKDYIDQLNNGIDKVDCSYYSNNKTSLTKIYNQELNNIRQNQMDYDYILYFHADVSTDMSELINKLKSLNFKYDVFGLAGTKKINLKRSPLNWFTGSNEFPLERYGSIDMVENGKHFLCLYNQPHHPDTADTEVACIDGLCIGMSKNVINSGFMFDESISDFDLYDTDLSLECNLRRKLKLGVIVQKTLHLSVGRSILKPDFVEHEKKLRAKYGI